MRLSKRLSAIAKLIPEGKRVIDIGCDHAFLDIYLTLNHKNHCIAVDIHPNVLEKTKEMISSYHLENEISVIESDGLENIDLKHNDIVVIAGMGTSTILHILKEKKPEYLIIQSNNDLEILRKEIIKKGYFIDQEEVICEKGIYYIIICFQKGVSNYSERELLFGPLLIQKKDPFVISYFENLLEKKKKIIEKVPDENNEKRKFEKEIEHIKDILK